MHNRLPEIWTELSYRTKWGDIFIKIDICKRGRKQMTFWWHGVGLRPHFSFDNASPPPTLTPIHRFRPLMTWRKGSNFQPQLTFNLNLSELLFILLYIKWKHWALVFPKSWQTQIVGQLNDLCMTSDDLHLFQLTSNLFNSELLLKWACCISNESTRE